MRLKTLKDLKTFIQERDREFVAVPLLKQEAIKWIKKLELNPDQYAAVKFIKHFFNITDEEIDR